MQELITKVDINSITAILEVIMVILLIAFWLRVTKAQANMNTAEEKERKEKKEKLETLKENKIAALPEKDLRTYLLTYLCMFLEIESAAYVSKNDPKAVKVLYATAKASLDKYLGESTLEAIRYFYTEDYYDNLTILAYRRLENSSHINGLLNGSNNADTMLAYLLKIYREGN